MGCLGRGSYLGGECCAQAYVASEDTLLRGETFLRMPGVRPRISGIRGKCLNNNFKFRGSETRICKNAENGVPHLDFYPKNGGFRRGQNKAKIGPPGGGRRSPLTNSPRSIYCLVSRGVPVCRNRGFRKLGVFANLAYSAISQISTFYHFVKMVYVLNLFF